MACVRIARILCAETRGGRLADSVFSNRQLSGITGVSSCRPGDWRNTGLLSSETFAPCGYARYSLSLLITLKTEKRIPDVGVSVQSICRCLQRLTRLPATIDKPLQKPAWWRAVV